MIWIDNHIVRRCWSEATIFSSDWTHWRYVAFLQTLVVLKKAGCGLALLGLKRTGYDVANRMSGKQHYSKCLNWPFSAQMHASSLFSPLINSIVHHALQKFSPRRSKTLPQLVHIADWYSICMKKIKKTKNLCILQGSAVTFFRCGG